MVQIWMQLYGHRATDTRCSYDSMDMPSRLLYH